MGISNKTRNTITHATALAKRTPPPTRQLSEAAR
nr:MAG TPA: hypothetical protein [Caudoviricetes sp.]